MQNNIFLFIYIWLFFSYIFFIYLPVQKLGVMRIFFNLIKQHFKFFEISNYYYFLFSIFFEASFNKSFFIKFSDIKF